MRGVAAYETGGRQEGLPPHSQLGNWAKPLTEDKILKTLKRHQGVNKKTKHIRLKPRKARTQRSEPVTRPASAYRTLANLEEIVVKQSVLLAVSQVHGDKGPSLGPAEAEI